MVGRLVEQQQVGFAGERAGEGQPLPPAAGERSRRLVRIVEPSLRQRDRGPGFALVVFEMVRPPSAATIDLAGTCVPSGNWSSCGR